MKKIFLIVSVLAFLIVQNGEAKELLLEDAISLTLKNSEDIQKAELDFEKAKLFLKESKSAKSFKADFGLSYQRSDIEEERVTYVNNPNNLSGALIKRPYSSDSTVYGVSAELSVSKVIYAFGKISKAIKAAQYNIDISKYQKEAIKRELRYAASLAYYYSVLSDELLKIDKSSYENALNSKKLLQSNEVSRPIKSDLIRISSDIALRKPEVDTSEYTREESYRNLKILCGISEDTNLVLKSQFSDEFLKFNKEELLKKLENNPKLLAYQSVIKMYESYAYAKKYTNYPTLALYGGHNKSLNSEEASIDDHMDSDTTYVGLSFNMSLWDGGSAKASFLQEKKEEKKALLNLVKAKKDLIKELRNCLEKYESYVKVYQNQKRACSLAKESYETSLLRFSAGQTSATELNDTEKALTSIQKGIAKTLFELNLLKANIEKLIGT